MKLLVVGIVLLAACDPVQDHTVLPDAPVRDSLPHDTGPDIDAPPPPPRCDPDKAFGAPVKVEELSSAGQDLAATLSSDELTVWFTSTRGGGPGLSDIYTATRATRTDPWGTPVLLANVNTTGSESHPTVTGDQLTLYFDFRINGSPLQVMRATRGSTSLPFSTPSAVNIINGVAGDNGEPFVAPDNSALYFAHAAAGGPADLYAATGSAGAFGTPAAVAGSMLATASNEGAPAVTPDQLNVYFRSDRGATGMDVWLATRTSIANGFGSPVNLTAVNTSSPEVPDWISADGCVLYFHRDIGQAAASVDVYVAQKPL